MKKALLNLCVNGTRYEVLVDSSKMLADVLREDLSLPGTKKSCDKGDCGACTIIIDGKLALSCLILAVSANGSVITTVEGLGTPDKLHPLQESFIEEGAVQCGYCTPGMLISAKYLIDRNSQPTEEEARMSISGNLCRCTGYNQIVKAILKGADKKRQV